MTWDSALVLAAGAVAFLALFALERAGRRGLVLNLVLGSLVLDCALFSGFGTSNGIFEPSVLGRGVSVTLLLAVTALTARWLARGGPPVLRATGVLWAFLLVWTAASGGRGLLAEHSESAVQYQLLVIAHLAVLGVLAATTPVAQMTGRWGLPLLTWLAAPLALGIYVLDAADIRWSADVVVFEVSTLGSMGADAATVFVSVGVLGGVIAMTRPVGARAGLVPAALLLIAPAFNTQRAAFLGLAASLLVVGAGFVLERRAKALAVHGGEVALATLLVAVSVAGVVWVGTLTERPGAAQAVSEQVAKTFASTAKRQSSESRRNQWDNALDLVGRAPVVGHGLGVTYLHFEVGPDELRRSDITHNLLLDVGVRSGLVGVLLLLLALGATARDAISAFSSRAAPAVRAAALGALAVLAGLAAKGAVESLFEKHRLAMLLGLTIGVVAAARRTSAEVVDGNSDPRQVAEKPGCASMTLADGTGRENRWN